MQEQINIKPNRTEVLQVMRLKIQMISKTQRLSSFIRLFFEEIQKEEQIVQNYDEILIFKQWTYHIENPSQSPICSKSIGSCQNKTVFRCYDCLQINNAIMCYDCFINSNHKGHSYRQMSINQGSCDCGDSQIMNQKAFCAKHSQINPKTQIEEEVKEIMLNEMTTIAYLYFWCCQHEDLQQIRQFYGYVMLEFLKNLIEQNYQLKILNYLFLNSNFSSYPALQRKYQNILQHFFNVKEGCSQLSILIQIIFQMYPVQDFKKLLIKQYFKISESKLVDKDHPFTKFSFQFLIGVKFIVKMIENNELRPLLMNNITSEQNQNVIVSSSRRYYWDLQNLSVMKKRSPDYHIYHFSLTNAADMAFYRKFRKHAYISDYQPEEFYLKILNKFIKSILARKDLIIKSMNQLLSFIVNFDQITFSMAQQRAFAMLFMALSEGQLQNFLQSSESINQLEEQLKLYNFTVFKDNPSLFYKILIQKSLKNKLFILNSSINFNTCKVYDISQKNITEHLDTIYQKCLFSMSKKYINYPEILSKIIINSYKEQRWQIIIQFINFFMNILILNIDEIIISNLIGFQHKQEILHVYSRIVATYNNVLTIKQFQQMASFIINNQPLIKYFIKNKTTVSYSNKLKLKEQVPSFQSIFYYKVLQDVSDISQLKIMHSNMIYSYNGIFAYQDIVIPDQLIVLLINHLVEILQKQSIATSIEQRQNMSLQSSFIKILIKIYLIDKNVKIQQILNQIIIKYSKIIKEDQIQAIQSLLKDKQELQNLKDRKQHDKQASDRKRKQKIQAKKKQKQMKMKQNQEILLKKFKIQEQVNPEDDICTFCRQQIKEEGHILCYIDITNTISYSMLKNDAYHIYFKSCGHKMHEGCFNDYYYKTNKEFRCFLCKEIINIIIPQYSKHKKLTNQQPKNEPSNTLLDRIYLILATKYIDNEAILSKINLINLKSTLLLSFCKELLFNGFVDLQNFRRWNIKVYKQIYHFFTSFYSKDNLQQCFLDIKQEQNLLFKFQENKQMQEIFLIIVKYLKEALLGNHLEQSKISQLNSNEKYVFTFLNSFIQGKSIQLQSLSYINPSNIFINLPKNIEGLHCWMGKCPFCSRHTNWLFYCLLCNFQICSKEMKKFHAHQAQHHPEGCIQICAANGLVQYIYDGKVKNDESLSIYEDDLNQEYSHDEQHLLQNGHKNRYNLNMNKLEQLFKMVLNHGIHKKIFQ